MRAAPSGRLVPLSMHRGSEADHVTEEVMLAFVDLSVGESLLMMLRITSAFVMRH